MAQKKDPRIGDGYSEVQNILKAFNITMSDKQMKETKTNSVKGIAKH